MRAGLRKFSIIKQDIGKPARIGSAAGLRKFSIIKQDIGKRARTGSRAGLRKFSIIKQDIGKRARTGSAELGYFNCVSLLHTQFKKKLLI
ncbi:hypothetical protein NIES4071_77170 [Calothrix sp. NIES-4071]|nr:hypothetical protein NIES4071_77170 [Calothrix sp. NIES-4071]BAZ61991.1 hypothetical protein NIES4105_77110 [Calothrix sp. NIES-4105]